MKLLVAKMVQVLTSSFWFVPAVMTMGAVLLAMGMLWLDQPLKNDMLQGLGWVYAGGPEGARAMLSTIAGSMITVAGTTFSITIAVLTLASSQFGPRLLGNFMRDRGNQMVLGAFIATFVYCLLVLRTVRGLDDSVLVPHLAVTMAVLLTLFDLGALIYFIHHVSTSIQAPQVVARAGRELETTIERLFPERIGHNLEPSPSPHLPPEEKGDLLLSHHSGYIQMVDAKHLVQIASEHQVMLRLHHRPGELVVAGSPLVTVWPQLNPTLGKKLHAAFVLGQQRTHYQDVEFGVDQLVEVALRALSPSLNDPFTAINVVDQLTVSLSKLAEREFPSPYRSDKTGVLRVVAPVSEFGELLASAFLPIETRKVQQMSLSGLSQPQDRQMVAEGFAALLQDLAEASTLPQL